MLIKIPLQPLLNNEMELSSKIQKLRETAANKQSELITINNTIEILEKELCDVQKVISSYFKQKDEK